MNIQDRWKTWAGDQAATRERDKMRLCIHPQRDCISFLKRCLKET